MSWWNPFGWSGGAGGDSPEGIWGAQPAAFRVASVLGEGSVVEAAPLEDAGLSSSVLGDIASGFGTAGAGFSQGGFGSPTGYYEPGRPVGALQQSRAVAPAAGDVMETLGVGFAA